MQPPKIGKLRRSRERLSSRDHSQSISRFPFEIGLGRFAAQPLVIFVNGCVRSVGAYKRGRFSISVALHKMLDSTSAHKTQPHVRIGDEGELSSDRSSSFGSVVQS